MTNNIRRIVLGSVLGAALCFAAGTGIGAAQETSLDALVSADEPPAFDDPSKAVDAFKAALAADDFAGVAKLLGLDPAKLKAEEGVTDTYTKIREGAAKQLVVKDIGDRKELDIGDELWPLPFPLVKGEDGEWAFDTYAGLEEVVNRRIGENELQAIATMHAYVDAQQDYASEDRDGDGVLEFAQKLVSSEGETDGLYWPADQGDGDSPAGPFVDQAQLSAAKGGEGYFGYRYRIITRQGDKVAGGAYDYGINGNMIAGFALIAWPVKYEETGVTTFVVNQAGIVYGKDLGPDTEKTVKNITRFNPDDSWEIQTED
jgi:hypothetical protein